MSITTSEPEIIYPSGFDERWEREMTVKGYLGNVIVRFEDGSRFQVSFIDPIRLAQDLQCEAEFGSPFFAEAGLIVVPEVTQKSIHRAIVGATVADFFDGLKRLENVGRVSRNGTEPH